MYPANTPVPRPVSVSLRSSLSPVEAIDSETSTVSATEASRSWSASATRTKMASPSGY
jgi:hypothetical protein